MSIGQTIRFAMLAQSKRSVPIAKVVVTYVVHFFKTISIALLLYDKQKHTKRQ
jgi:hypothetical protein